MRKKTYVADVAFESVAVGDKIIAEPTQRLEALLGAGYLHEMSGPVYRVEKTNAGPEEDSGEDAELLERFEDEDVVETSTTPVASKRRTRKE